MFRKLTAMESYILGVLRARNIRPPHHDLTPKWHENRWCWVNEKEEVHSGIDGYPTNYRTHKPGSDVPGYDHCR